METLVLGQAPKTFKGEVIYEYPDKKKVKVGFTFKYRTKSEMVAYGQESANSYLKDRVFEHKKDVKPSKMDEGVIYTIEHPERYFHLSDGKLVAYTEKPEEVEWIEKEIEEGDKDALSDMKLVFVDTKDELDQINHKEGVYYHVLQPEDAFVLKGKKAVPYKIQPLDMVLAADEFWAEKIMSAATDWTLNVPFNKENIMEMLNECNGIEQLFVSKYMELSAGNRKKR